MNILADFLGINELKKLKRENLAIQAQADAALGELSRTCPDALAAFLLASRAVSRRAQGGSLDAGLGEVREAVKEGAEDSIALYRDVPSNPVYPMWPAEDERSRAHRCASLRALTKKMTASPGEPEGPTPPDVPGPGNATALRTLPPRLRGLRQPAPG